MGATHIISIENDVKQWSTLYVAYHESKRTEYKYTVRCGDSETISGSFLLDFNDFGQYGFTMGSRYDNTRFLKGEISSLET